MASKLDKFDSESRDVLNYLESRDEICDIKIQEANGVSNSQIGDWENRNLCNLPQDLKNFYLIQNGLSIEWSVKLDDSESMSLGKIQINSIKDLTKVGSVLSKDYREPSIFDLEDLQSPPNMNSFDSISNINSILKIKENSKSESNSDDNSPEYSDEEDSDTKKNNKTKILIPHFDDLSRNFELDNCNGYGKVCLVYRNAKPGMMISEQSAEIWYLDRSLQWHFLTNSFKSYYRLAISHLGLPQWQMLFTEDGLPPFLNQWYYLFCPGRILVHQEKWKKLEFLSFIENNSNNNINKKPQNLPSNQETAKKIDFSKLFEDKNTKKTSIQASHASNTNSSNNNGSKGDEKNGSNNTNINPVKPRASLFVISNCADINPYQVLGVSRNADEKQIRDAYRKSAKHWHPDRNKSPDAHEKFMQINKAYEILSDAERRSLYDDYGTTNEPRHAGGGGFHRESYDNFFRDFDPFEGFFGGGFGFNQKRQSRKNPEEEVNKRLYEDTIFPNSHIKPYLIYTYTEFCFSCIQVESIWQVLKQEVKNIGFGVGHSDASWNRELSKLLEIRTVPSIVAVINGRISHFRGDYNLKELREFIRSLLPSRLVTEINQNNFNTTLKNALNDNKVFSVFISSSSQITLRYQMPCFQMVKNIKCTSIRINRASQEFKDYLAKNYKIPSDLDKQEILILFKEKIIDSDDKDDKEVHRPYLIQASSELAYNFILQSFESNKNLILPRISSSSKFFDICPQWSEFDTDSKNVLCCIIISNSDTKKPSILFDTNIKDNLIKKLQSDRFFRNSNIQLTYIYSNIQNKFIEKISKNSNNRQKMDTLGFLDEKIVVLKRLDEKYAMFDIIDDISLSDSNLLDLLKMSLSMFKNDAKQLKYKMTLPSFYEESNQDLISFVVEYFETIWDYVTDRMFWERLIGNNSYMMIILCTFLFLWLMIMFSSEKSNPNSTSKNARQNKNNQTPNRNKEPNSKNQSFNESYNQTPSKSFYSSDSSQNTTLNDELYNSRFDDFNKNTSNQFEIVEMNSKTEHGLITHLPKGFRTILLIVNQENKKQLVDLFTKVCKKYSNKSYRLRFGFLNQSTFGGKKWLDEIIYKRYQQLGVERPSDRDSEDSDDEFERIDEKNLIDLKADCNVLAINNSNKYYIPLNFRLNDPNGSDSSYLNLQRRNSVNKSLMEQSIGFEESYSIQMENKFVLELSNWLDKFTEGLLSNKTQIKEWPEM
ncbi:unnamed protein product, partial [Brachionus calyciflorus]